MNLGKIFNGFVELNGLKGFKARYYGTYTKIFLAGL